MGRGRSSVLSVVRVVGGGVPVGVIHGGEVRVVGPVPAAEWARSYPPGPAQLGLAVDTHVILAHGSGPRRGVDHSVEQSEG